MIAELRLQGLHTAISEDRSDDVGRFIQEACGSAVVAGTSGRSRTASSPRSRSCRSSEIGHR